MIIEAEHILEDNLIAQREELGYKKAIVNDENELLSNLKDQLERHNKVRLSENDFRQILNYINKGNIFERAKILRDRVPYTNQKTS